MMAALWILVVFAALAAPAFGQSLGPPNAVLTPGERATSVPAIAANTGNADALVVWSEESPRTDPRFPSPNRVVGRLFAAAGPRGDLIEIAAGGDTNPGATQPVVAFNSARGEYFVVYRRGAVTVVARRLSADGLPLGPETEIAAVGVVVDDLAVAYNATANEYLVVWRAVFSGVTSQRVDATGGTVGPARTLAPFPVIPSTVTFNPRTLQYLVMWSVAPPGSNVQDPDAPGNDVFGQLVNGDGTLSGVPFAVIAAKGSQAFASAAANSTTGRYLVVWQDSRKNEFRDTQIAGRVLNADGSPAGNDFTISALPFVQIGPSVAFLPDSGGRFFVVWSGASLANSGTTHVFGRMLDGEGAPQGPLFTISGGSGAVAAVDTTRAAALAASPSGAFLTVWHDARNFPIITGQTQVFGAAVPVSFAPPDPAVETFVTGLYLEILGRVPSATEVVYWSEVLRSHPTVAGASALIHAFLEAPEFPDFELTPAGRISQLYEAVLGREPDPGGQAALEPIVVAQLSSIVPSFVTAPDVRSLGTGNLDTARIIVDHWYMAIFGRSGTSDDIPWIVYLRNTRDFTGAAQAFFSSPEYLAGRRTFADHATVLYRALFGRDPGPAERDALVEAILQRFVGVGGVGDGLIGSVEFQTLVSGLGDPVAVDALIRRFYQEALGRTPADFEVASWRAYLLGTRDVTGAAHAFFASAEYQSIARSQAEHVRALYRTLLGRDPAPAEQSAGIETLTARLNELIPPLVASPAFQFVPLVVSLYEILLLREPSAFELSAWTTYLGATGDIPGVLTAFFTSPEYVSHARRLGEHVGLLFRVAQSRLTLPDERAPYVAALRSRLASVADILIGSSELAARLQTMLGAVTPGS